MTRATRLDSTALIYLVLVAVQRGLRERRDRAHRIVTVNERSLARYEHRWSDVPMPPDAGVGREHAYAWDLNILGRASIAQRIARAGPSNVA